MDQNQLADDLEKFEKVLDAEGMHAALAFLNARAPHRFTGIYQSEPPVLRNVRLFDRTNPALEVGADAPLRETYCSITSGEAAPFSTGDSQQDARLQEHPARDSTLSYCGVPLLDDSGAAVGTLCHFDLVPQEIPRREIALMEAAAPRILGVLRASGAFP